MMPRSSKVLTLALVLLAPTLLFTACTDEFSSINTNPVEPTAVPEDQLFTRSVRKAMLEDVFPFQVAEHLHANMFVQHFANPIPSFNTDRYEVNDGWATVYWDRTYTSYGKDIQQVIDQTRGDEQKVNKLAQARIWKVFIMLRLTDFFGDVPYSEAFQGNNTPAYDPQEEIYRDFFTELSEAVQQFDASKQDRFGASDVLFQDDLTRWKRFANSLRLRIAMRVSGVDAALAEQQASAAVSADGGLLQSRAQLLPSGGSRTERNPLSTVMAFQDSRVSNTMEDTLRALNDPRLEVYVDSALAGPPFGRRGYPNGLTPSQIDETTPSQFSIAGPEFQDFTNPISVMSLAEVKFLQAEAVVRGYISGDAGTLYEEGIEATMDRYDVDASAVNAYLGQSEVAWDPNASTDVKIQKIILQKWIALFGRSGFEAWAEYRRTGEPELREIAAPGGGTTNGVVPRRVPYPNSEEQLNAQNYNDAVGRLDEGDTYLSRMWWDVN